MANFPQETSKLIQFSHQRAIPNLL